MPQKQRLSPPDPKEVVKGGSGEQEGSEEAEDLVGKHIDQGTSNPPNRKTLLFFLWTF